MWSVLAGGSHFAVEEQNVFDEKPFLRRKIGKIHFHKDTGGNETTKTKNIIQLAENITTPLQNLPQPPPVNVAIRQAIRL
ncbi:hypothetical protein FACS1894170_00980 [Planctomycetales bacterium]|nr:hypothetical protein FACS1894170_00980 [Planctomycetales bacterium]